MIKRPSWDEYFMRHAYLAATKSKDNRTKIGAVLVSNNRIIAEGYNGIVQNVKDCIEDFPERYAKPEKYFWQEHGERNCYYDCSFRGVSSNNSTLYTFGIPCADCARAVVQGGTKTVVVHKQWQNFERKFYWEKFIESARRSRIMFDEAKIQIYTFDMELGLEGMLDGNEITV